MPLSTGAHKIFDAGEAAFLPKQLQAYVAAFELFVARKVKAGQSSSLRAFDWAELSRIIGDHQAHQLEFIILVNAQNTRAREEAIAHLDDRRLPPSYKSHSTTHEVDMSKVPNVVERTLLLSRRLLLCSKQPRSPEEDPRSECLRWRFNR